MHAQKAQKNSPCSYQKSRWQSVSQVISRFGAKLLSVKKIQPSLSSGSWNRIENNISQKTGGTEGFCGMNTGGTDVIQPEFVM